MSGSTDPDRLADPPAPALAGVDAGPPRGPLIVLCAVLIMAPTVAMLGICVYLTVTVVFFGAQQSESPMNLLTVVLFPVPLMLILMFEYQAVVKKSAVAALLVGALFLFPLIPGGMSLAGEMSGLVGADEAGPDVGRWGDVGVGAACLALATFIGVVHLRWWRRLTRWYYEHVDEEPHLAEEDTEPGEEA